MSKKKLPVLKAEAIQGITFEPPKSALSKWNTGLQAAAADNSISIFDVIGRDEWGGVSAKKIAGILRGMAGKDVVVNINSPGGDVFEGIAIYNLLREHQGSVTVKVIGLAASAASLIAMAGDTIQMARASFMMIHNVWVLAIGNRNDMRAYADFLEPFDAALADVYAFRTGNKAKDVAGMMDAESWFSGTKAVENGFADELLAADYVTEDDDENDDKKNRAPSDLVRAFDATLLKAGVRREERTGLIMDLRNMLSSSITPESINDDGSSQPLQEQNAMNKGPNATISAAAMALAAAAGGTPPDAAAIAAAAAAAGTAAPTEKQIADAVKADRDRGNAIMALDEAKGRDKLAAHLVNNGTSLEEAKAILAAAPKANSLNESMQNFQPGIQGQEAGAGGEQQERKIATSHEIFASRKAQVEKLRGVA